MAGLLGAHGVMVRLVLALVMAPLALGAAGAEPVHHIVGSEQVSDPASNIAVEHAIPEELDACDHGNRIRMPTDGPKESDLDGVDSRRGGLKPQDAQMLPQLETAEKPADMAMSRKEQADAPADGPSPSGSPTLAVSLLVCVGMALLGLIVA